ncbi:hypothetical protein [Mesorhizobium sp. WSM1293]|uniref:hypothetical protein n=1 Tax=Mesorhizobium sp. WSM1293 TaxID=1040984 RepID=UPI0012EC8604|nr:hypothetical protein [Mesorhizobium sp. WSM1293]
MTVLTIVLFGIGLLQPIPHVDDARRMPEDVEPLLFLTLTEGVGVNVVSYMPGAVAEWFGRAKGRAGPFILQHITKLPA